MPPTELQDVIAKRVEFLDADKGTRRMPCEALTAQRVLKVKHQQTMYIHRKDNIGGSVAAPMFTRVIIVSMF